MRSPTAFSVIPCAALAWLLAGRAATGAAAAAPASPAPPQATEASVPIAGGSLHYTVRGRGEPVLVLSGGPGFSGDYMEPVATELASSFRTILPDQRGTGRSTLAKMDPTSLTLALVVEDLELMRRHLGVNAWSVLGHSWGGMLAMAYATAHPEAVRALVLIDSGGPTRDFFSVFGDNLEARMQPADLEALAFWRDPARRQADPVRASYEGLRARVPAYFFARKNAWPFIAAMRPEHYTSAVNRSLLADLERINYDLRPSLGRLHLPALIVQCRQDPVPESVALELHALLAGSQLLFLDRCGHFPWLEQGEKLYTAVRPFLAGSPAGRP